MDNVSNAYRLNGIVCMNAVNPPPSSLDTATAHEEIGAITLTGKLEAVAAKENFGLYRKYTAPDAEKEIKFIPYYSFANHGEREMLVWFNI